MTSVGGYEFYNICTINHFIHMHLKYAVDTKSYTVRIAFTMHLGSTESSFILEYLNLILMDVSCTHTWVASSIRSFQWLNHLIQIHGSEHLTVEPQPSPNVLKTGSLFSNPINAHSLMNNSFVSKTFALGCFSLRLSKFASQYW